MHHGKYVNKEHGICNCPHCRGVIFREFRINRLKGEAVFIMRCPHCQKDVLVTLNDEGVTIEDVHKKEH